MSFNSIRYTPLLWNNSQISFKIWNSAFRIMADNQLPNPDSPVQAVGIDRPTTHGRRKVAESKTSVALGSKKSGPKAKKAKATAKKINVVEVGRILKSRWSRDRESRSAMKKIQRVLNDDRYRHGYVVTEPQPAAEDDSSVDSWIDVDSWKNEVAGWPTQTDAAQANSQPASGAHTLIDPDVDSPGDFYINPCTCQVTKQGVIRPAFECAASAWDSHLPRIGEVITNIKNHLLHMAEAVPPNVRQSRLHTRINSKARRLNQIIAGIGATRQIVFVNQKVSFFEESQRGRAYSDTLIQIGTMVHLLGLIQQMKLETEGPDGIAQLIGWDDATGVATSIPNDLFALWKPPTDLERKICRYSLMLLGFVETYKNENNKDWKNVALDQFFDSENFPDIGKAGLTYIRNQIAHKSYQSPWAMKGVEFEVLTVGGIKDMRLNFETEYLEYSDTSVIMRMMRSRHQLYTQELENWLIGKADEAIGQLDLHLKALLYGKRHTDWILRQGKDPNAISRRATDADRTIPPREPNESW
jgi:hypothetical protein